MQLHIMDVAIFINDDLDTFKKAMQCGAYTQKISIAEYICTWVRKAINHSRILNYMPDKIIQYICSNNVYINHILEALTSTILIENIIDTFEVTLYEVLNAPGQISNYALMYMLKKYKTDTAHILYRYLNDYDKYTDYELFILNAATFIEHAYCGINKYAILEAITYVGDYRLYTAYYNKYPHLTK